jgi:pilus assembly protein Flp/PilA
LLVRKWNRSADGEWPVLLNAAYVRLARARDVGASRRCTKRRETAREVKRGEAMKQMLMKLWKDEEAPTAVEYGIMVALIAVAIIATVQLLGGTLDGVFSSVQQDLAGTGTGN